MSSLSGFFYFNIKTLILVGIYWLKIKDRVRDGYTPTTSMSRYETNVLKEFFGSIGLRFEI